MRRALPSLLGISLILFFTVIILNHFQSVSAAPANHIVISQIKTNGASDNEFVELYNPTDNPVDLSKWKLTRKNSSGSEGNLVASLSGTIDSRHYFLIGSSAYAESVAKDFSYSNNSNNLTNSYTVLLYDKDAILVDKVGFGSANDFETALTLNPTIGGSIQRKLDETNGHGLDTDNNSSDFEVLSSSSPRNSLDIVSTPTPIPTALPTPTEEPSATPSVTPTVTPSPTAIPSVSPLPTALPSPTSTIAPTNTPSPTITNIPVPSIIPSISPAPPTPTPKIIFSRPGFSCALHYRSFRFFNKTIFIPFAKCTYP